MVDGPNSCDPCACISGYMTEEYFWASTLQVLCDISTATTTGENVNLTGINGVAPSVGAGASDTGTLRVTQPVGVTGPLINEDSAATNLEIITKIGFVTQATLSASDGDGDWGWGKKDTLGRIWTTATYLEDVAAVSGDQGHPALFRRTDTAAAQTDTTGDYTLAVTNSFGSLQINIDSTFQAAAATGILKVQGGTFTAGDAGVEALARYTTNGQLAGPGDGKYGPLVSLNGTGALLTAITKTGFSTDPVRGEDDAYANGEALMVIGVQREDTPTATTGASLRLGPPKANNLNVLYSEPANQVATYGASITAGAAGGVTTAGASVLTNSAKAKILTITSTLDVPVQISPDAGTTYPYTLPIGPSSMGINLGATGRWTASNIFAKAVGGNSAAGSLYVGVTV